MANGAAGRARGVVKSYGSGRAQVRVLDGIDLDVAPGEVVAVVGRSGSGKSTLLHLLGALDRPDEGSVVVGGVDLTVARERELAAARRRLVGFVFQSFQLLPELNGLENVLLAARVGRDREALVRGRELVRELGLAEVAARLPATLSGGEQQRLAVARALVNDPVLVLADEPTGNLDADSGALVLGLLREAAARGKGVLLVTHDPEALGAADRILRLERGRLAA